MQEIAEKIQKITSHPFTRDVVILQLGMVFNTGLAFLTSLIFARFLGPEQYGFYTLVFALAGTVNLFQDFGIGQAATNLWAKAAATRDRQQIIKILLYFTKISIWTALTVGLLGTILTPFIGQFVYHDLYLGKLAAIVVATTALTFFFPLAAIALQVVRRISFLAILEGVHKVLFSGIPIILLLLGFGVLGIASGQFAAMILSSIVAIVIYRYLAREESNIPQIKEFVLAPSDREGLRRFFRYGFSIAVDRNLAKLLVLVPILLVGYFLPSTSALGFYKVAMGYMSLPLLLLKPVSRLLNVQFPYTEAKSGEPRLLQRFFQVSLISVAITAGIALVLLLLGPFLIELFYGRDYMPSIQMIYPLFLYPIFLALGVGIGPVFRTLNKMKVLIGINTVSLMLLFPSAFYLIKTSGVRGLIVVVLFFSIFPTALEFIYLLYKAKSAKQEAT